MILKAVAKFHLESKDMDVFAKIMVCEPDEVSLEERWPQSVEFYSNLKNYEISGRDREYPGVVLPEWSNPTPVSAYIHSGISFYRGEHKTCQFDSGLAGYLVGPIKEDIEKVMNMLENYPEYETEFDILLYPTAEDLLRDRNKVADDCFILEGYFSNDKDIIFSALKNDFLSKSEAETFEWITTL